MKCHIRIWLFLVTAATAPHTSTADDGPATGAEKRDGTTTARGPVRGFDETTVVPVLDWPIEHGKNLVYCSTFQLAWNELRDQVIGSDVELVQPPRWVATLNRGRTAREDVGTEGLVALSGRADDHIVAKVNNALRDKFGPAASTLEIELDRPHHVLVYAYLHKALPFKDEFDAFKSPIRFESDNRSWPVACFGISGTSRYSGRKRRLMDQVSILSYTDDSRFTIKLEPANSEDEIILAKGWPGKTLLECVNAALAANAPPRGPRMSQAEPLWIPKITLDIERRYREVERKPLRNQGWERWYIEPAVQHIRFNLDERGATLDSDARMMVKGAGERNFIFDRPFLVLLRRKGRVLPYFVAWIDNAELLQQIGGIDPVDPIKWHVTRPQS